VVLFEVMYFFFIAMLWIHPEFGLSIGAATGVANGGLMFQFLIGFPLWAPLAVIWARYRFGNESLNQPVATVT